MATAVSVAVAQLVWLTLGCSAISGKRVIKLDIEKPSPCCTIEMVSLPKLVMETIPGFPMVVLVKLINESPLLPNGLRVPMPAIASIF
ncbi:hypothetical protein D3C72_1804830 [compost metagenome]